MLFVLRDMLLFFVTICSVASGVQSTTTQKVDGLHSLPKHPPVTGIVVKLRNKTSVRVDWKKPPGIENRLITSYDVQVRQMLHEGINSKRLMVKPPVSHVILTGLHHKVVYNLRIYTVFKDLRSFGSKLVRFSTENVNVSSLCLCDPYGSFNVSDNCTPNSLDCHCRKSYTGAHCSICTENQYREEHRPCTLCPCSLETSSGQCVYDAVLKRSRCLRCKNHREGPMCEMCIQGYHFQKDKTNKHKHSARCVPCNCPKTNAVVLCNFMSGHCEACPNGTSGAYCEHCAFGWSGQAPHCRPYPETHSSVTVVTALVTLILVAIGLLLGYWVMRVRARRKRLNAWSLELNRYELEQPGLVDAGSHSGLMMEEAPTSTIVTGPSGPNNDYGGARLQLRQSELSGGGGGGGGGSSGGHIGSDSNGLGKPAAPLA